MNSIKVNRAIDLYDIVVNTTSQIYVDYNNLEKKGYKSPNIASKLIYSDYFILNVNPNKYNLTIKCKPVSFSVANAIKQFPVINVASTNVLSCMQDINNDKSFIEHTPNKIPMPCVSINVGGHLRPTFEVGNGQSLMNKVSISCQKQMYFEFEPKFETGVLAVTNLPNGVRFKNGIIKGAPSNGGNYKSSIVLKDGTIIDLDIKVSNIWREL